VYVVGSSAEASTSTHLTGELEAAIPFVILASQNLGLILGLFLVLERELDVELQSIPDALPDANPLVGGSVMARNTAATIDPGSGASRRGTPHRCRLDQAVLHAGLAVPRATRWHPIEAGAEYVGQLLAAVAVHKLGCIAKLIAHHACVIAAVIFECVIVVLDDHGRVDIGNLLLV
jgi:hypothetical protein